MKSSKKNKPLQVLADFTSGKSYATHRYCLDVNRPPEPLYSDEKPFVFEKYGETQHHKQSICLTSIMGRVNSPLFSFFLDGSRRTYKVDDIAYGSRIYPIIAGQVGVSCCVRHSPDDFKSLRTENRVLLAVPISANPDGGGMEAPFFNDLKDEINSNSSLKKFGVKIDRVIAYPEKEGLEYGNLAIAALHEEMLDMEKEFVDWLVQEQRKLGPGHRLIKDGSVDYQKSSRGSYRDLSRLKSNYKCVVGVSKKFNPEKCVDYKGQSKASLIAQLPLYHRTPAFKFRSSRAGGDQGAVHLAAWYIRIRDLKHTVSPFDGVIKAERILVTDNEIENGLDSEEVDLISANLACERNPTCYGRDLRWANHLYPIYLTELSMKNRRMSDHAIFHML